MMLKTNILETLDFADAVNVAVSFARKYPNETLIIVTADHETGGMTLGRERGYVLTLTNLLLKVSRYLSIKRAKMLSKS